MRERRWGWEFQHHNLFREKRKENVDKGDAAACRHFCLCLGTANDEYWHFCTWFEAPQRGFSGWEGQRVAQGEVTGTGLCCGCPSPGSAQGRPGQGLEQPGIMEVFLPMG